jgi:hypoxanthine-guanine phosphoribosyltransferase
MIRQQPLRAIGIIAVENGCLGFAADLECQIDAPVDTKPDIITSTGYTSDGERHVDVVEAYVLIAALRPGALYGDH